LDGDSVTTDEREWLEARFDRILEKLDEHSEKVWKSIAKLSQEHAVMKATPCSDTARHILEHHDPAKKIGILASIVGIVAGVAGGVSAVVAWAVGRKNGQ
jgi:hypothetical protein